MGKRNLRWRIKNKARATAREVCDENECYICGSEPIEVHHIDGDCLNNHPLNLVALCRRHHQYIHNAERTQNRLNEWKASLP